MFLNGKHFLEGVNSKIVPAALLLAVSQNEAFKIVFDARIIIRASEEQQHLLSLAKRLDDAPGSRFSFFTRHSDAFYRS